MRLFKIISSILLILLIFLTSWLFIILFVDSAKGNIFFIKFIIYFFIFIIFIILTIYFIIQNNYNILFITSYFIITLFISYNIFTEDLLIKYIPLILSTIYMLLNRNK